MEEGGLEGARILQRKLLGLAERNPRASSRWEVTLWWRRGACPGWVGSLDHVWPPLGIQALEEAWVLSSWSQYPDSCHLSLKVDRRHLPGWDTQGTSLLVTPYCMTTVCSWLSALFPPQCEKRLCRPETLRQNPLSRNMVQSQEKRFLRQYWQC